MKSLPRLIVALDVQNQEAALAWVDRFFPRVKLFKIGSVLFTRCGPDIVKAVRSKGAEVFLDLKFHDIPNTVAECCRAVVDLDVFMVNLHLSAGEKVARESVRVLQEESGRQKKRRPLLLGVSVLTHLEKEDLVTLGWKIQEGLEEEVGRLASLGQQWGLDGVICSPQEIATVRSRCGADFCIVAPGIRPVGTLLHDQRRTLTPQEAVAHGADFIVVGRPILESQDPLLMVSQILEEVA